MAQSQIGKGTVENMYVPKVAQTIRLIYQTSIKVSQCNWVRYQINTIKASKVYKMAIITFAITAITIRHLRHIYILLRQLLSSNRIWGTKSRQLLCLLLYHIRL